MIFLEKNLLDVDIAFRPLFDFPVFKVGIKVVLQYLVQFGRGPDLFEPRVGVIDHRLGLRQGHHDPIILVVVTMCLSVRVVTTLHELIVQPLLFR